MDDRVVIPQELPLGAEKAQVVEALLAQSVSAIFRPTRPSSVAKSPYEMSGKSCRGCGQPKNLILAENLLTPNESQPQMTPDPTRSDLQHQLSSFISGGYRLIRHGRTAEGCDQWRLAWEVVKQLATADIRSTEAFDRQHRGLSERVFNWFQDFEMELGNAGLDDPRYHQLRVDYVREFLVRFPDESSLAYLNMRRAEADALWELDRRAEAETVFSALAERLPDEAWCYIGWADCYWLLDDSPKDYETAEAIMRRALERPNLLERADLLERLADLYDAWGKSAERDAIWVALEALQVRSERPREPTPPTSLEALPQEAPAAPPRQRLGRNDPCWCGSGRKYKRCHLRADQQGG